MICTRPQAAKIATGHLYGLKIGKPLI